MYEAVRDELVPAHAHYRPGLRPWAWWKWDAPELRRVVGRDLAEDNEADCFDDRLPAAEDPNLPEWAKGKTYFGKPSVYDDYLYEDEYIYLQRLDLLFAEEKAIFKKYDSIINVYVQQGERENACHAGNARARLRKGLISIWTARCSITSSGFRVIYTFRASIGSATAPAEFL